MNFTTEFITAAVPVTVITSHGDIDASNYQDLIHLVQMLYKDGTRNVLLDLKDSAFVSSSGLVALHSVTLFLNGGKSLDIEDGWSALREMAAGPGSVQAHLKLLNVGPRVDRTLDISGLKQFYQIFTDLQAALASFQPEKTAPSAT